MGRSQCCCLQYGLGQRKKVPPTKSTKPVLSSSKFKIMQHCEGALTSKKHETFHPGVLEISALVQRCTLLRDLKFAYFCVRLSYSICDVELTTPTVLLNWVVGALALRQRSTDVLLCYLDSLSCFMCQYLVVPVFGCDTCATSRQPMRPAIPRCLL